MYFVTYGHIYSLFQFFKQELCMLCVASTQWWMFSRYSILVYVTVAIYAHSLDTSYPADTFLLLHHFLHFVCCMIPDHLVSIIHDVLDVIYKFMW